MVYEGPRFTNAKRDVNGDYAGRITTGLLQRVDTVEKRF